MHFLILGGAIFAWFDLTSPPQDVAEVDRIVITGAELERASLAWSQRRQRPPDPEELQGIVDELVRQEVLYREALALGLDRDDVVIRSLLRQKFEFVTQDLGYETEPDEAVLREYHAQNAERYSQAARLSFSQIMFSIDKRGSQAQADARQVLTDLQGGKGPEAAEILGDGGALGPAYDDLADFEIEALFGPDFSHAILTVEAGRWSGPIQSGFGYHLVWVTKRADGAPIPFAEVAQKVRDDWIYEQRAVSNEAIYRKLLERYDVTIEAIPAQAEASR